MTDGQGAGGREGHYFADRPQTASKQHVIEARIGEMRLAFVVDRQVFSGRRLDPGTLLLLESIGDVAGAAVLDMGCGWGAIGLTCLKMGAGSAVMVDMNSRALACAGETARMWGITPDLRQGDGFQAVGSGERYDLVVTNPPVRAGKGVYYPWVADAAAHVAPGGRFVAVIRVKQGADSFEDEMKAHFGQVRRLARQGGYRVLEASDPLPVVESGS